MLNRLKKEEKLVITFYTTTQAMHMEDICKELNVKGRLIPVPTSIFAGCGLAWCADLSEKENIVRMLDEMKMVYQDIHQCII